MFLREVTLSIFLYRIPQFCLRISHFDLLSIAEQHIEAIKLLLEAKAGANIVNKNGDTPLIYAASENHTEAMKLLLEVM